MHLERIKQKKVSDIVMQKLIDMIVSGVYRPGEKMPPERDLAKQLGTSRPSLRIALNTLELQGYIIRVQGGGNYVSNKIGATVTDPLLDLFIDQDDFKYDLLEYRHALEEAACYLAAERATEKDKEKIRKAYQDWMQSFNNEKGAIQESEADLNFHLSIAEASHNLVLPHAMLNSIELVQHSIVTNLEGLYTQTDGRQKVASQHKEMLDAICNNNPERARKAVKLHLEYIKTELEKNDIRKMREERYKNNLKKKS